VRSFLALLVTTILTASVVAGGCSDENRLCYPGDYRACMCSDGRRGYEACAESGNDFGRCDCSVGFPDAGTGNQSSSSSSTGGYQSGT
jgi:hypothetical protein